ncbi:6-N-hydroxylaminopurine resistance protein [compost metagenome]
MDGMASMDNARSVGDTISTIRQMKVKGINIGKPVVMTYQNKEIMSGFHKTPIDERIYLSSLNFDGDGQGDLKHHGGVDKAVCVYPFERYAYWEQELGLSLTLGAFGENVTTEGMLEDQICIGDIFQFGEAVVQVSQPRQPCYKIAARYGVKELPAMVQETGYTGYYLRVLQEGWVNPEDTLTLKQHHAAGITLQYANQMMFHDKENAEGIQTILDVEELSSSWRDTFTKRLGSLLND